MLRFKLMANMATICLFCLQFQEHALMHRCVYIQGSQRGKRREIELSPNKVGFILIFINLLHIINPPLSLSHLFI